MVVESLYKPYNAFGQIVRIVNTHHTAEYTYLPNGMRRSKTVSGRGISGRQTITHIWDGMQIIAETDGSGAVVNRFTRGIGLIHSEHHGWYVVNGFSDVVQRVDDGGEILHSYRYNAFGQEQNQHRNSPNPNGIPQPQNTNPHRYRSKMYDHEVRRIATMFRQYCMETGRFLSEDPIRCGLNWYTYCMNNPIMWDDPTGLSPHIGSYESLIL